MWKKYDFLLEISCVKGIQRSFQEQNRQLSSGSKTCRTVVVDLPVFEIVLHWDFFFVFHATQITITLFVSFDFLIITLDRIKTEILTKDNYLQTTMKYNK